MTATKNAKKDRKPALEHVCPHFTTGVGDAMRVGEEKYGARNFMGLDVVSIVAGIERHAAEIKKGNFIDQDCTERLGRTVYHWDCAGAGCNMLSMIYHSGKIVVDKLKQSETPANEGSNKVGAIPAGRLLYPREEGNE